MQGDNDAAAAHGRIVHAECWVPAVGGVWRCRVTMTQLQRTDERAVSLLMNHK